MKGQDREFVIPQDLFAMAIDQLYEIVVRKEFDSRKMVWAPGKAGTEPETLEVEC